MQNPGNLASRRQDGSERCTRKNTTCSAPQPSMSAADAFCGPLLPTPMTSEVCHLNEIASETVIAAACNQDSCYQDITKWRHSSTAGQGGGPSRRLQSRGIWIWGGPPYSCQLNLCLSTRNPPLCQVLCRFSKAGVVLVLHWRHPCTASFEVINTSFCIQAAGVCIFLSAGPRDIAAADWKPMTRIRRMLPVKSHIASGADQHRMKAEV